MLRVKITWTFTSPVLQVASGIVEVEDMDMGNIKNHLFKCKIKKDRTGLGYSSMEANKSLGIPYHLFEEIRPMIDTMARSYQDGMILEKSSYDWVEDSADRTLEEWATERLLPKKGIIMERITSRLKDLEAHNRLHARIGNIFDSGVSEGIKLAKNEVEKVINEIQDQVTKLKVIGVCGVCGVQYKSYNEASTCCSHLKGKDYDDNKPNQVFKV